MFRPSLRHHQARFDRLTEPDLVGQEGAFGERGREGEERGVHLMGIEVDLSTRHRARKLFRAVGRAAAGQVISDVLRMVVGQIWRQYDAFSGNCPDGG